MRFSTKLAAIGVVCLCTTAGTTRASSVQSYVDAAQTSFFDVIASARSFAPSTRRPRKEASTTCDIGSSVAGDTAPYLSDLTEIIEHNCDGELSFFNNHNFGRTRMSLGTGNIVNKVLSAVGTHVTTRMKALCPGLAEDADVSGAFEVSIAAGFTNVFSDSADAAAKVSKVKAFCAGGVGSDFDPASWFDLAQEFDMTFPSTCDPARYATDGCVMQYNMADVPGWGGLGLQLAMKECPGQTLPYFSVTCNGHLCKDMMKPCADNNDCKGSKCGSLTTTARDLLFDDDEDEVSRARRTLNAGESGNSGNSGEDSVPGFNPTSGEAPTASHAIVEEQFSDDDDLDLKEHLDTLPDAMGWLLDQTGMFEEGMVTLNCSTKSKFSDVLAQGFMDGINNFYQSNMQAPNNLGKMCGIPDLASMFDGCIEDIFFEETLETNDDGNATTISDSNIETWDGVLSDGTSVFAATRLNPTNKLGAAPSGCDVSISASIPFMHATCDGTMSLSPGSPIAPTMQISIVHQMFVNFISPLINSFATINDGKCSMPDEEEAAIQWNVYRPPMWMKMFTTTDDTTKPQSGSFYEIFSEDLFERSADDETLTMPSGCTLADYLTTGVCKFQYSGLKNVLASHPVTLRFTVSDCPGSFPSMYVDCVDKDNGDACRDLVQIYDVTTCATNSDCTYGECSLVDDLVGEVDPIVKMATDLLSNSTECAFAEDAYRCCSSGINAGKWSDLDCFFNQEEWPFQQQTCEDGSDKDGSWKSCQPWGTAGDTATVETALLELVGSINGKAAPVWKAGVKGICLPTIADDVDNFFDSLTETRNNEITISDMEPYSPIADDSCDSTFDAVTADSAQDIVAVSDGNGGYFNGNEDANGIPASGASVVEMTNWLLLSSAFALWV